MKPDVYRDVSHPFYRLVLAALLVFATRFVRFPALPFFNPITAWITAVALIAWIKKPVVIPGMIAGYLAAGLIPASYNPSILDMHEKIIFEVVTGMCLTLSAIVASKSRGVATPLYGFLAGVSLCILAWFSLKQTDGRIALVYFAASTITVCLSCVKNASSGRLPSLFFIAWLSGYIPWILIVRSAGLDPSGPFSTHTFVRSYLLIPFSVYILHILIGAHIIHGLTEDKT